MPNRLWHHVCGEGQGVLEGSPQCATCGAHGVFEGWRLSMWEAAARYHRVYALNPFGPHRAFADSLFAGLREPCLRCGGRSVLTTDEKTWMDCPTCAGTGGSWNCPPQEVDELRQQVLAQWPLAALSENPVPMAADRSSESGPERDTTLEDYKQYLWASLRECQSREDRRELLNELERINLYGRAAIRLTGTDE